MNLVDYIAENENRYYINTAINVTHRGGIAKLTGPFIQKVMLSLGEFISFATEQQPLLMGMLVALVFGLTLSSPISSAALALMLNINGTAAAAATIGCCCHMVGFAVTAYKDNGFQSIVAHGIGTSKIQIPNYMMRPLILVPPVIASIIIAPIMTTLWPMHNVAAECRYGDKWICRSDYDD